MQESFRLIKLGQTETSYLLLATLIGAGVLAGILFRIGFIGLLLNIVGRLVRGTIRRGFLLWEHLLSWATWPIFLGLFVFILLFGGAAGSRFPALRILCGLIPLVMGMLACFAYMFIDLERNEVERGHKAIHNPLKGQLPATNLGRYGKQVRVPLLISAAAAVIGGFALLNQGLYQTIGASWYKMADDRNGAIFVDFLAFALMKVLGLVDVLDLAASHRLLGAAVIKEGAWPATALLTGFKVFFTVVLLHQLFASLRQGKLLAETIADFWSPHEPIHERARNALPAYGSVAIGPLLLSLRSVSTLTKEQRDQLPLILETIGPGIIPTLLRHLGDSHEHVRAVVAASLGQLRAMEAVPSLVSMLQDDTSDIARRSVVEALGMLGALRQSHSIGMKQQGSGSRRRSIAWLFLWRIGGPRHIRAVAKLGPVLGLKSRGIVRLIPWPRRRASIALGNPVALIVDALDKALGDESSAVRTQAATALGTIGPAASSTAPQLIALLKEPDETVRRHAAAALGQVGGDPAAAVEALTTLLSDPSASVKADAARALGVLKKAAAPAVSALAALLQDRDETVRDAAAEAISQVGPLDHAATDILKEGLASPDNVIRAQTAEALGTIGASVEDTAPALAAALTDGNDRVRGKAAEALGKIGEAAAETAVPSLVRALRDQDNWVSALAAEALGQMGESADAAVPAVVNSLKHLNPQVRGNAAEALGNLGETAFVAIPALERAARDEDPGVRVHALRALSVLGRPSTNSISLVVESLHDADPTVRVAAIEALGRWGHSTDSILTALSPLLGDPNELVKVTAIRVLPKLSGPSSEVIDALCGLLLEIDSAWVQVNAALALGKLGPAAAASGEALLRVVQTGEGDVREQAMRAIALIQPPETADAFLAGLKDSNDDVRLIASAGWMKADMIPEDAIPALIEALRDPEIQVRANAANALGRLETLPEDAVPLLIECAADSYDGLRLNAAMALKPLTTFEVTDVMLRLLVDSNSRVRFIAASSLLASEPTHALARSVLSQALEDPSPRIREAAVALISSLDTGPSDSQAPDEPSTIESAVA